MVPPVVIEDSELLLPLEGPAGVEVDQGQVIGQVDVP